MTAPVPALVINGRRRSLAGVPDPERLLDSLRTRWRLTGTKEGCRTGGCGACTVLVDGRPTLSCLTLTRSVVGGTLVTIEGADTDPVGRRVTAAFEAEGALQCGYCTPGFVLALAGLLKEQGSKADAAALLEDLGGNLCRCTGYASIRRATERLQKENR